jgi:type II secretory pathway component HofQ
MAIGLTAVPTGAMEVFSGEPINLELVDANLEDVLVSFSELTGLIFAVEPQAAVDGALDHKVDVLFEGTPWDQVLDEILTNAGLAWTLEGKVLWIHEPGYAFDGDRTFTGQPINLRLNDADIHLVMENFSKITESTIEVDPGIETLLTVSLKEVPWDQIFDLMLRINGLAFTYDGDVFSVYRRISATGKQILPSS